MSLKSIAAKWFASWNTSRIEKRYRKPRECQEAVLSSLLTSGAKTAFGKDHNLTSEMTFTAFQKAVPLVQYEELKTYINRAKKGEENVLWTGKPLYFCKTSGTTSGAKYIPITKDSIKNQINGARNTLLSYIHNTGNSSFVDGKMIFLQGSPELEYENNIPIGRLSGIVAHHVPNYLLKNREPSWDVNCIEDWEEKVNAIARETQKKDMSLISGIPSWVQMYFEVLLKQTGASSISELFPNFSLFVHGGVNYRPYAPIFDKLIGKKVDTLETYPASEGFIAYQDKPENEGLLLIIDDGIFYEFVKLEDFGKPDAQRIPLWEVEKGVNYAIVLHTNAGLWGYVIGDTVKFVSTSPYRIIVSGRISHYTSAFGEHVIAEEVEGAMKTALQKHNLTISEFHVAPQIEPKEGELPYHEWFVESDNPEKLNELAVALDAEMQERNPYYKDLIKGKVLQPLKIIPVSQEGFHKAMKSRGKLGGQNKVPRLANDREFAQLLCNNQS